MAKQPKPRATTPARRASILKAALDCFIGQGVEATTIDDIRRASGSSIGSLYHHFGNKEGIAAGLFIDGIQRLNADLLRKLKRCKTAEDSVQHGRYAVLRLGNGSSRYRTLLIEFKRYCVPS